MEEPGTTISVVIPLYNKKACIGRALDSVLRQTFTDWEVVVVDDGSSDGGSELVGQTADPRVRLFRQENRGVSAARNRGVELARGEFVAFLDADDEWRPDFLAAVWGLAQRFPDAAMFATAYEIVDGHGDVTNPSFQGVPLGESGGVIDDFFFSCHGWPPVCASSVLIRKERLAEVGGFPEGIGFGEDLSTWMQIALRHKVAWCSRCCSVYHRCGGSSTSTGLWVGDVAFAQAFDEYAANHAVEPRFRQSIELCIAKHRLARFVRDACLAGETELAQSLLAKTKPFRELRRKWLLWRLASLLPTPLLRGGWRLKQRCLGLDPTIGPISWVQNHL